MNTRWLIVAMLLVALAFPSFVSGQAGKTKGKSTAPAKGAVKSKRARPQVSKRVRRISRAFVASSDLKPMAVQLLQNRTRAAYAGVEAYARRHARDEAGSLAYLVLGYARILDREYGEAIPPLRKAQAQAGELGDYVAYFLGSAYGATGQAEPAAATLRGFEQKYPDSVFGRDAAVIYANALLARGEPRGAITVLEKHRSQPRGDVELAIGRAYLKAGEVEKAADALRRVYYVMPTSAEATEARVELDKLGDAGQGSFQERKLRAETLAQSRRFSDAAVEYRGLVTLAPPQEMPAAQVGLGSALRSSGRRQEARELLERMPEPAGDAGAQRLYLLAEIARSDEDEGRFRDYVDKLRQSGATTSWFEDALLSGGNMYLLKREYDKAIDFYRELQQRFPGAKRAAYAHWKTAWLSLRQGRAEEARRGFEQQVAWYPQSGEVPAALYWRARLAEEERDTARARAFYNKISDRFRNYYYAELARERLRQIGFDGPTAADPLLDRVPGAQSPAARSAEAPADNLRVEKSRLLQNGGLFDLAVRELQAAGAEANWVAAELARLYKDNGQYHRGLQVLKRAVPSYYSLDVEALPRNYWETLFPRPYWTDLKRFSVHNQLDPFLVASLIRQESEFNPGAVSRADALGLMQILPSTGRRLARELRIRRFSTSQLLVPTTNLQMGTTYFRKLMDQFDGRLEYALAAYNAGPDRVEAWLSDGNFRDTEEFVESIPFTETREYVQAILRNSALYRRLYKTP